MTLKEYMDALDEALSFMPKEQRQAILDYYAEMLADCMEDGMAEAAATAAMEPPAEIAARLRADSALPPDGEKQEEPGLTDEAIRFSSLAGTLLRTFKDLENAGAAFAPKGPDAAPRPDAAPPRSQGKSTIEFEEKTFSCPAGEVRAIRLLLRDMPIQISPCAGKELTLRYFTCDSDPYDLRLENGVLTLAREQTEQHAARFIFSILGGAFRIGWAHPSPTVELSLPGTPWWIFWPRPATLPSS